MQRPADLGGALFFSPATVYSPSVTTYLLKTEPDDYSYEDLERDTRTPWDGVTNPTACMVMRGMSKGDQAFIYHTGKERRIVGLCRVLGEAYADPARPDLTAKGDIKYPVVDVARVKAATTPVTLAEMRTDDRFEEFVLLRQSRLSVMEVPPKLDKALRKMCGL